MNRTVKELLGVPQSQSHPGMSGAPWRRDDGSALAALPEHSMKECEADAAYREHIRRLISDNMYYVLQKDSINASIRIVAQNLDDSKLKIWMVSLYRFLKQILEQENFV